MTTTTLEQSKNRLYTVEQIQDMIFRGEMEVLSESILSLLKHVESQLEIIEYPPTNETQTPNRSGESSNSSNSRFGSSRGVSNNRSGLRQEEAPKGYRNKFDMSSRPAAADARNHKSDNRRDYSRGGTKKEITDNDWQTMRDFKTTKIETKTGIDKQANDLRVLLNKISAATYEKQRDAIIATFRDYFALEEAVTEENTAKLAKTVFDIASTNKFYSELYANLIKELVAEFDIFRNLLAQFVETFCATSTQNIVYIDPDVDYDGYCAYTKQSDIRKSTATFIVCCLMRELVELDEVIDIVIEFLEFILRMKDESGKIKEVEEITELVFIMVCAMHDKAKSETKWEEQVMQEVERLSKMKAKDYASLSNRAVFKFMDLMDKL